MPTLHEDADYLVVANEEGDIITLVMPERGISFVFDGEEWEALKKIVSEIELPEAMTADQVTLYEDDIDLFSTDGEIVEWDNEVRMFKLRWHIAGWEKFRHMMMGIEG